MKSAEPQGAETGDESADALNALSLQYGLEVIDSVEDELFDPSLIARVPVEWVRSKQVLPVRVAGRASILTADPGNVVPQEDLSVLIGEDLRPVLARRSTIMRAIERCYYSKEDKPDDFIRDMEQDAAPLTHGVRSNNDLLEVAEQAPVTQLVNLILLEAVKRGASDIHFEPFASNLRVRYRVDGVLYEQSEPPKHMEDALVSRLKVMARMDIAERRLPQDGMAKVSVGRRAIDIRVSTVPVAEGERVVLRLLDRDAALLPLDVLGMRSECLTRMERLLAQPHGMIVVAGPTGSGKTTTLYAAMTRLDTTRLNVMTIEEPIEYQLPGIGQIQVKPKIGLTFSSGLRHILRQDPDIILVGETRDLETADIAIRASLTGHLVFTTLHTNDAPGAVVRLVDMGVEPFLVASCLRGVLAQRLVRCLCAKCRRKAVVSHAQAGLLGSFAKKLAGREAWEAEGCPDCLEGYSGRTGLFELMEMNDDLAALVRSGQAGADGLYSAALAAGMHSLLDDGIGKILDGTTSVSDVSAIACA